jgi:hypothetical protein
MANLYEIQPTDCIGNSRVNINSNFQELNNDVIALDEVAAGLRTDVNRLSSLEEATKKYVNNASFMKESTFTYGFSNIKRPALLANRWVDIYTNVFRDPLKIEIQLEENEGPKAVLLQGRTHVRHVESNTSAWVRLARFGSAAKDIQPEEVLDISSTEGTPFGSLGTQITLQGVYVLQPGIKYVFGLQTYFWLDETAATYLAIVNARGIDGKDRFIAKKPGKYITIGKDVMSITSLYNEIVARGAQNSSIVINGWGADDSFTEQYNNTINPLALQDVQATNKYTNDGQSGTNRIGKRTKYGYGFDEQAIERGVKNSSFIRAIVI